MTVKRASYDYLNLKKGSKNVLKPEKNDLSLKMLFSPKTRNMLLLVFAGLSCLAGLYHFVNLFYKMDASPHWRHLLFVGINLFCVVGFIKRPPYFVYFLALLFIQQCYSHGTYLVDLWQTTRKIHWISVFDLLLIPIGLILLIEDQQAKKRKSI